MTEELRSRQSAPVRFFRELARNAEFRRENGLYLCDGEKLLQEALRSEAEVCQVVWREKRTDAYGTFEKEYLASSELFDYISPMKNSPGPLFSVRMKPETALSEPKRVLLLEGCADVYAPKTVRASMGAVFRQNVLRMTRADAVAACRAHGLPLFGAALSPRARDLRKLRLDRSAVAIGSEGHGLSEDLLRQCDGELIIPMSGEAESLNAGIAAAIVMWEMCRQEA